MVQAVARAALRLVLAALLAVPLGIVVTLLLLPFWRWLEAATGIEAIGHSGPAEWCYAGATLLVFLPAVAVLFRAAGGAEKGSEEGT